jgi:hypothetical protein
MTAFGQSNGGGRRSAPRTSVPAAVTLSTLSQTQSVVLIDVSSTGARVRGGDLPPTGEYLEIKIDTVRAFGFVAWIRGNECGLSFDEPLEREELARVRMLGGLVAGTNMTVEEKLALEDWIAGAAR